MPKHVAKYKLGLL